MPTKPSRNTNYPGELSSELSSEPLRMLANNELTGFAGFASGSPPGSLESSLAVRWKVRWHSNHNKSSTKLLVKPMDNLRELATDPRYETIKIKAVLTPFPVRFEFPIELRETTPRSILKEVEGTRILRFYTAPVSPDIIEFRGHLWKVSGRFHEDVKVKGSPQKDRMPIVVTEYIGPTE